MRNHLNSHLLLKCVLINCLLAMQPVVKSDQNIDRDCALFPTENSEKIFYMSVDGSSCFQTNYTVGDDFSEGFAVVGENGKRGFIDCQGKLAVPLIYDEAFPFSRGLAAVMREGKWGFIDYTGTQVVPLAFHDANSFSEGLAAVAVSINGKILYGYIGIDGEWEILPRFSYATPFQEGRAVVVIDGSVVWQEANLRLFTGRQVFISYEGEPAFQESFERAYPFHNGRAVVQVGNKWGVIDEKGRWVVNPVYDEMQSYSEGLAGVAKSSSGVKRWGFIDDRGNLTIDFQFSKIGQFRGGLAPVKMGELWGYIDSKSKVIIDYQFDYAKEFNNGLAYVIRDDLPCYINPCGNTVYCLRFQVD